MDNSGELLTEVETYPSSFQRKKHWNQLTAERGNSLHGLKEGTTQLVAAQSLWTVGVIGLEPTTSRM